MPLATVHGGRSMRHVPLRCVLVLALLFAAATASAQSIILVRHAERADTGTPAASMTGADPDLSGAGLARAGSLAAILKDAKITAIYVTEYKRTKQTAAPLATTLGIEVISIPSKDTKTLAGRLKTGSGNVLVVGHSNTLPVVLEELGVTEPVTIADTEFDNLFIVSRAPQPSLVRLRYR
jgi:broad specificity phosphatase PhoE